jgi:hypothetical protein
MRNTLILLTAAVVVGLVAGPLMAQTSTGALNGRVSYEGDPLPGVTVSLSSPALQGTKTAITSAAGDFNFPGLPPGTYKVTFALDSFKTLDYEVKISTAQSRELDVIMYPEAIEEEIVVTGQYETVSSGSTASSTVEYDTLEKLPVGRTPQAAVGLSAGTTSTGPGGNTTISGAQSYENLYTLNGVVLNENLRGQPFNMFIEDAIQETTVVTSGVSAEYGRFAGGVVNMVTKTGGNEFSGSFRINMDNDDWSAKTPFTAEQEDDINEVYEATFGGFVLRDKLWFFTAGRDRETTGSAQITTWGQPEAGIPFPTGETEERFEIKLTGSITPSHRVTGTYIDISRDQTNDFFFTPLDERHIDPERSLPLEGMAFNYTGVISDNFFVEAQYSERDFAFVGSGGDDRSLDYGTPIWDGFNGGAFHAPLFCGVCSDEERNNENTLAKASWFVSSEAAGSHDLVFGYDSFTDIRIADNWQSASGWLMYTGVVGVEPDYSVPGQPQLFVEPGFNSAFGWGSVLQESQGTDFETNSLFVNDTWRVTDQITVNLGLRYDENDGTDAGGAKVVDDSRISPRLGMTWDLFGDGQWILNASAARYVTAIANNQADAGSSGGQPTWAFWFYGGPSLDARNMPGATWYDRNAAVLAEMFNWYFNVYGGQTNTDLLWFADMPGLTPKVADSLSSPYGDELSIGITKRLGNRGVFRADVVHREYGDFYASEIVPNRTVSSDLAGTLDLGIIQNEDDLLRREYDALMTRIDYRFSDRLMIGGNWTWSHARGNFDGETGGSGPVPSGILEYQEYKDPAWNTPMGDLAIDQRHKVRVWGIYDLLSTARHNLSVSVLQNYWSGTPYSATAPIEVEQYVGDPAALGYAVGPGTVTYYFSGRGEYTTDDITRTDLSLNYSFFANLFGAEVEMFVQPEVLNLFNEDGVVGVNSSVRTLDPFNPFTEEPVEGTHWEKGANFGEPTGEGSFQLPRTFRVSLGIRF